MKTEKTEKTLSELEVELNQSYDWSKILDGIEEIEMIDGPGYKGLRNIGSSCYMNAVVQTILSVPEVCIDDDE
jgi:ubiquitin carboxyl-terminal hydrolase 5/13